MHNEPQIIAEVASNHAGDVELAKKFISEAARAGADCVKFQTYFFRDLVNPDDPQANWVKQTELPQEAFYVLIDECKKHNIKFLTTCFGIKYVDFLASLGMYEIKVASPDLLSFKMIKALANHFSHIIISTGMHTIEEIVKAVEFLKDSEINATLLHTVSLYPTPAEKAWMEKFHWLKSIYPRVGYSDHVPGIEAIKYAIANGATIIEKHFKLGKSGPGRASVWDATPEEMTEIVKYRRLLQDMQGYIVEEKLYKWLDEGELKARDRFIGRWGDNR